VRYSAFYGTLLHHRVSFLGSAVMQARKATVFSVLIKLLLCASGTDDFQSFLLPLARHWVFRSVFGRQKNPAVMRTGGIISSAASGTAPVHDNDFRVLVLGVAKSTLLHRRLKRTVNRFFSVFCRRSA
jgi:hypothetical protein